jgi:hypothetical protein
MASLFEKKMRFYATRGAAIAIINLLYYSRLSVAINLIPKHSICPFQPLRSLNVLLCCRLLPGQPVLVFTQNLLKERAFYECQVYHFFACNNSFNNGIICFEAFCNERF